LTALRQIITLSYLGLTQSSEVESERASGTLIVPLWRSAVFWPVLCPVGVHFGEGVSDWADIVQFDGWVIPGRSAVNDMFSGKVLPFRMLAVRFDFSQKRRSNAGFCTKPEGFCDDCGNMSCMWY